MDTLEPVDGITGKMLALAAYETDFSIYDHGAKRHRPYALIAMHVKEDYLTDGLREQLTRDFRKARVHHHYGIGLHEFFSLERWYADFLLDDCNTAEKEEAKRINAAMQPPPGGNPR